MKKTILISTLLTALFIFVGTFSYLEYKARVCEKQIMQYEHKIDIRAEKGNESKLFELYNEIAQEFENIKIEFFTENENLEFFIERNKNDVLVMQHLNGMNENPFGSSIEMLVKLIDIDNVEDFENYIKQKADEKLVIEIDYGVFEFLSTNNEIIAKIQNPFFLLRKNNDLNSCKIFRGIMSYNGR